MTTNIVHALSRPAIKTAVLDPFGVLGKENMRVGIQTAMFAILSDQCNLYFMSSFVCP